VVAEAIFFNSFIEQRITREAIAKENEYLEAVDKMEMVKRGLPFALYYSFKEALRRNGYTSISEVQDMKEFEEIKFILTSEESQEDLEEMIRPLIGDKESEYIDREERLWTDIDKEMETEEEVKGEWTVAKYVLIKNKVEEIQNKVVELNSTLNSLSDLIQKLVNVTTSFLKLFEEVI